MGGATGGVASLACVVLLAALTTVRGQNVPLADDIDLIDRSIDRLMRRETQDSLSNFTQFTRNYGYDSEEHVVITEDGYILYLFRIPKGKNCNGTATEPPVLLMHGLLQSSDAFLDAGPSSGLAFLLSDACYDTWVGNVRGNYYGRRHVSLDPNVDAVFWNFTTEEMGVYDLPAIMDYMLEHTGSSDVMYVGFSQGCRLLYTMASETSGNVKKIRLAVNMAPAARLKYTRSLSVKLLSVFYAIVAKTLKTPRQLEILNKGGLIQMAANKICSDNISASSICQLALVIIDSCDPGSVSTETIRSLFGHFPAGTSAYVAAFYGQGMISQMFQKYDYGPIRNLQVYGNVVPPLYDLKKSTMPVVLIYGNNDFLVDPRDVRWLSTELPHVVETYEVERPTWDHLDNTYSGFSKRLIFPKINQYFRNYSRLGRIP